MTPVPDASGATALHQDLADGILRFLAESRLEEGTHVSAQLLADRFHVSRSPIQNALKILHAQGHLSHAPRRGYFLAARPLDPPPPGQSDPLSETYFRIAEDRLSGRLSQSVSEALMRERYDLSPAELKSLLNRMLREGWVERRPGYGWRFGEMLTTPGALEQTYRLRTALEPAILLEPTFHLDTATIDRLEQAEQRLLDGEIATASTDALYARGVTFHETLAQAGGNPYMLDALRRMNQIRRLLAYRSMVDRQRYYTQATEHLEILSLIRRGRKAEASEAMRRHIGTVIANLQRIEPLLSLPANEPGDG